MSSSESTMSTPKTLGLLAAGEGSRLRSDGVHGAKGLVTVVGEPLAGRTIRRFVASGIERVVVIVNEDSPDLAHFLRDEEFGVPVSVVVETTPSSLHSLHALAPHLADAGSHFFLSMVDSVFSDIEFLAFTKLAGTLREANQGAIGVTAFVDDEKPLFVDLDESNTFITAVGSDCTTQMYVTGGLYCFPVESLQLAQRLVEEGEVRLRRFQQELVRSGVEIRAGHFSKIVDVDHAHDIAVAEAFVRELENERDP